MNLLSRLQEMDAFNGPGNDPLPATGPGNSALQSAETIALQTAPGPVVVDKTDKGETRIDPSFLAAPESAEGTDATPAPGQVNPPKRRGRPTNAEKAARAAAEAAKAAAAVPATAVALPAPEAGKDFAHVGTGGAVALSKAPAPPPEAVPRATEQPAEATAHRIAELFVGCLPMGRKVPSFDDLIAKAKVMIGPVDYRVPPNDYGRGNGLLLSAFQAIVQYEKPAALVVLESPESTLCVSYLRSISNNVVEAVR